MMSCGASVVWSHLVLSHCYTEHDHGRGIVLSGRITIVAISNSGQLSQWCTVAVCPHVLRAMMTQVSDVSVTCGHALETREPTRIGRLTKLFFILEVYGPQRAMEHVTAPEPSRAWRRVRCWRTRGSTGALPSREAGSGSTGHVIALEPSLAGRQDQKLQDM
jgi:hypothetical protein